MTDVGNRSTVKTNRNSNTYKKNLSLASRCIIDPVSLRSIVKIIHISWPQAKSNNNNNNYAHRSLQ